MGTSRKEIKTVEFTKANYVGLTVKLEQYKEKEFQRHGQWKWGDPKYRVAVSYIAHDVGQFDLMDTDKERIDKFELKTKYFYGESVIEASALFEAIRNKVRNLGEFRNLNKRKIPDYRDEP